MTTANQLAYNGYKCVLVRYPDKYGSDNSGEPALWIEDNYYKRVIDDPKSDKRYFICDSNERQPLDRDADITKIRDDWKIAVGWDR